MRKMLAALALLLIAGAAHADWSDTLKARDLDGNGTVDAYFDTDLNITWLKDANFLGTNNLTDPTGFGGHGGPGVVGPGLGLAFISTLDVFGTTGWRVPNTTMGAGCIEWFATAHIRCPETGSTDQSELAHLGLVTLGGDGTGPFINYVSQGVGGAPPYWLNMLNKPEGCSPWCSVTSGSINGLQYTYDEPFGGYAWFVHGGDVGVAPIPEPSTYALMLAGLGAMGWVARRRKVTNGGPAQ